MALSRLSKSPVGRCEAVSLVKEAEATLGSAMAADMLTPLRCLPSIIVKF